MSEKQSLIQALEYIKKQTGKSNFIFYMDEGRCYLSNFSKNSIAEIADKYHWDRRRTDNSFDEENGVILWEMSPTEYLLIDGYVLDNALTHYEDKNDFNWNDTYFYYPYIMICTTDSLSVTGDEIYEVNGKSFVSQFRRIRDKEPKKVIPFTSLNELKERIKTFNKDRYNKNKSSNQFKSLPMSYRAHKSTPKRKTGLRQLENSVRKMF